VATVAEALGAVASALERCDLDALTAQVPRLEAAAFTLRRVDGRVLGRRAEGGADALHAATRALARCRRLGASLVDALRLSRVALDVGLETYGPRGHALGAAQASRLRALNQTV
jgi:hypothetical protein